MYELGEKGSSLKIQVEYQDTITQHQIKEDNREVWRVEKIKDSLEASQVLL